MEMSKFYTAVVIEYFPEPVTDENEISQIVERYKDSFPVLTPHILPIMPRGSILGKYIDFPENNTTYIFYPLLSHISMPAKPGEQIFVLHSEPIGYWLTRKVSDKIADDPNYTHNDRSNFSANIIQTIQTTGIQNIPARKFPSTNRGGIAYNKLVDLSSTYKKDFQGEVVPRYPRVSSDLSLEGTNNTLLLLGNSTSHGDKKPNTGMIDIVAGRGVSEKTKCASTFQNDRSYDENDKTIDQNKNEGKLDFINDLSRVHISMNMNPDDSFSIQLPQKTVKKQVAPVIVNKTNKYRIVARNDVAIVVEGNNGSSVVLNDNGDIFVTPGSGKVYLNGPSSDQPYLRYDEFNNIIQSILDILGALQSSIGPGASAAVAAFAGGAVPGTPFGDDAINGAVAAINNERFIEIGKSSADINLNLQKIKSKKIVGS